MSKDKTIEEILLGYLQGLTLSSGNCFDPNDGVGHNARKIALAAINKELEKAYQKGVEDELECVRAGGHDDVGLLPNTTTSNSTKHHKLTKSLEEK